MLDCLHGRSVVAKRVVGLLAAWVGLLATFLQLFLVIGLVQSVVYVIVDIPLRCVHSIPPRREARMTAKQSKF